MKNSDVVWYWHGGGFLCATCGVQQDTHSSTHTMIHKKIAAAEKRFGTLLPVSVAEKYRDKEIEVDIPGIDQVQRMIVSIQRRFSSSVITTLKDSDDAARLHVNINEYAALFLRSHLKRWPDQMLYVISLVKLHFGLTDDAVYGKRKYIEKGNDCYNLMARLNI